MYKHLNPHKNIIYNFKFTINIKEGTMTVTNYHVSTYNLVPVYIHIALINIIHKMIGRVHHSNKGGR